MPNWCEGNLKIYGTNNELKRFYDRARDAELLSADRFIPYPRRYKQRDKEAAEWSIFSRPKGMSKTEQERKRKQFKEKWGSTDDGFNSGGYDWCITHWGTKWGFCDVNVSGIDVVKESIEEGNGDGQGILIYDFETAWAPITPVIEQMAKDFPELSFNYKYEEPGMGFVGEISCVDGHCSEEVYDYVGCEICGDHIEHEEDGVTCAVPGCVAVICPTCNENFTEDNPWLCMNHEWTVL